MSDKVSCSNYPGQTRVANLVDIALQMLQFASFPQVVTIKCTNLLVEFREWKKENKLHNTLLSHLLVCFSLRVSMFFVMAQLIFSYDVVVCRTAITKLGSLFLEVPYWHSWERSFSHAKSKQFLSFSFLELVKSRLIISCELLTFSCELWAWSLDHVKQLERDLRTKIVAANVQK